MCGISGQFSLKNVNRLSATTFYRAHSLLRHRGPDDEGFLAIDASGAVLPLRGDKTVTGLPFPHISGTTGAGRGFLGHSRLSIIDLSVRAHQPMGDEELGVWVVFNGEIYNYVELRDQLQREGHQFNSHSDTEVLLKAYRAWGKEFVRKLDGMWAFCLLDTRERSLFLSRDRSGQKPLYYSLDGDEFLFSSEQRFIRALKPDLPLAKETALRYLHFGYLDDTGDTFFSGLRQLPPATNLTVSLRGPAEPRFESFWDIPLEAEKAGIPADPGEFLTAFEDTLKIHLRSDVPVGVALSGGLDSNAIACTVANKFVDMVKPFYTFSVAFDEEEFSERTLIERTVQRIKSRHIWIRPNLATFPEDIRRLHEIQEIPIRSLSVYANNELLKVVAKTDVKVIMGGQGADELFGGYSYYSSYLIAESIRRGRAINAFAEFFATDISKTRLLSSIAFVLRTEWGGAQRPSKYDALFGKAPAHAASEDHVFTDLFRRILFKDFRSECLPEYLHYEDRNSMAYSLETRLPFLGKEMIAWGFRLSNEQKIFRGRRKRLVRDAFQGIIPQEILDDRKKKGFLNPQTAWQRTKMRPLLDDVFAINSLSKIDLLDAARIRRLYDDYLRGDVNDHDLIWRVCSFALWHENVFKLPPLPAYATRA